MKQEAGEEVRLGVEKTVGTEAESVCDACPMPG